MSEGGKGEEGGAAAQVSNAAGSWNGDEVGPFIPVASRWGPPRVEPVGESAVMMEWRGSQEICVLLCAVACDAG
jgi:hypothetical protein